MWQAFENPAIQHNQFLSFLVKSILIFYIFFIVPGKRRLLCLFQHLVLRVGKTPFSYAEVGDPQNVNSTGSMSMKNSACNMEGQMRRSEWCWLQMLLSSQSLEKNGWLEHCHIMIKSPDPQQIFVPWKGKKSSLKLDFSFFFSFLYQVMAVARANIFLQHI